MKIVVTGANGFVGAALCRYFYQAGHSVVGLGRQPQPPEKLLQYADYIAADITQKLPVLEADVCVHAAALASDTAAYAELYKNNVTGTAQVLEAAINCKYYIQISSSSVYAFGDQAMPEQAAILQANLSPYGTTKLLADNRVEKAIPTGQHRLILRPRAIYGPGDRVLLPCILTLVKGNKLYLPVPPVVQTSMTHVDNIGYAIALFLQQLNPPALQIFNLADEPVYNLRDIIRQTMAAVYSQPLKEVPVPAAVLKALVGVNKIVRLSPRLNPMVLAMLTQSAVLDISQIKKHLCYAPPYTFAKAIPDISQWVKQLGGVASYLAQKEAAPWLIPDSLIKAL